MKTKRAWIVAFATIFAGISLALVQNKVAPCMTTLMGAFNIDMATAGWLSSLFSLVGIVMAIPASIVLNKPDRRRAASWPWHAPHWARWSVCSPTAFPCSWRAVSWRAWAWA